MVLSRAQQIELFHLAFLEVLSKRLEPSRYVLKGGANLRYFFGSPRYSEDIDIDLTRPLPGDMEGKVGGILDSAPLALLLRGGGLEVSGFTAPKQTETTRRWKVSVAGPREEVRTKIEFSGRETAGTYRLDRLPTEAAERAFELPFDAYRDQVLAFLEPEVLELYDGAEAWERMQTAVAGHLEAAR
jgi:hypothetical protein